MSSNYKGVIPGAHVFIRDSVLDKNNPLGISVDRSSWASKLSFDQNGEYTFFAGCGYQTMKYTMELMNAAKRMKKVGIGLDTTLDITNFIRKSHIDISTMTVKLFSLGKKDDYSVVLRDAVKILQKLGFSLNYLGHEEPCCGSPLYYSGFINSYKKNAKKFYETIKKKNIKKIISMIPACTHSIKNIYPEFLNDYDVEIKHFLEVVDDALNTSNIQMALSEPIKVVYHDPCQLSRYLGVIEEPRRIMSKIKGLELLEVDEDNSSKWSSCCGGGGGLEVISPDLSERIATERVEQLLDTGADMIVTSCPFCLFQLKMGVHNLGKKIEVRDMAQVLASAVFDYSKDTE